MDQKDQDHSYEDDGSGVSCFCIPRVLKCKIGCVHFYFNPIVTGLSIIIIWSFVLYCAVFKGAKKEIGLWNDFLVDNFSWFFILSLALMGSFCTYLCFSKYGDIKLGPNNEEPRYSIGTWFSMLFSAGIGVGLYFFGVAEPIFHYNAADSSKNRWWFGTPTHRAMNALNISWFHWGLTASSVYCIAGLPLAYYHHVKAAPLKLSTCFTPLLGKKYVNSFIGDMIDIISVVGTMFGVATSLGLGTMQLNAGLNFLDNEIKMNTDVQTLIIWSITLVATISVFTGLDVGIRRLSEVNFIFSLLLVFYLFFVGDTFFQLNLFVQGIGYHFQWLLEMTFSTQAFEQAGFAGASQKGWMASWTIFYWAWWYAWAPFVGIFIAQISRGRTIREFILGNMIVPTLMTSIWLTIFGGLALYSEMGANAAGVTCKQPFGVYHETKEDLIGTKVVKLSCFSTEVMLFQLIQTFPLPRAMSILALVGIITYFVTSSDSASHVIDMISANGNDEPPKIQRIFWALTEGATASFLLRLGGKQALQALQTASIIGGLPVCFVMLFLMYSFLHTIQIHMGEIDPKAEIHFQNDMVSTIKKCPNFVIGIIFPPVVQILTRNKMIEHQKNHHKGGNFPDSCFMKYFWILFLSSLWTSIIILFFLGFFFKGFYELGLSLVVMYLIMCTLHRGNIRKYYNINGNVLCDCVAYAFCWCCASVQEQLQAYDETIQLVVKDNSKHPLTEGKEKSDGIVTSTEHSYDNNPNKSLVEMQNKQE